MINSLKWFARRYLPTKIYDRVESPSKTLLMHLHTVRNHFRGRAFYCKALNGESRYNISVKSDMTVTCNCSDMDGSGIIGNLSTHTLREIFEGDVAKTFRRRLARGIFAIPKCRNCPELTCTDTKDARVRTERYDLPEGIMVENTALCNLKCLWCDRDQVMSTRLSKSMSLEDIEKIAITLRDYDIKELSYFLLGEPFFSKRLLEELTIIKKHAPHICITTSTNGVLVDNDEKREAALLMERVYFSVDGPSQEKVVKYQVGAQFDKSYANMKRLVEFRDAHESEFPIVEWKYVVFAWNDSNDDIDKAIELAMSAGVDAISFWYGQGPAHFESKLFHTAEYFLRLPMVSEHHYEVKLEDASLAVSHG